MSPDELDRVRDLWRELTGAADGFRGEPVVVVGADDQRAAPPGWTGIVRVESAVVIATPSAGVDRVRRAVDGADVDRLVEPAYVEQLLGPVDRLGPARLFYGNGPEWEADGISGGPFPLDDERVQQVVLDATGDERGESGITHCTSGIYLASGPDGPAAVAGWREWPHRVAHVSILTAASQRGQRLALAVGSHALAEAARQGFLPQWRSAHWNQASTGLARRLGLHEVGEQYSVLLR